MQPVKSQNKFIKPFGLFKLRSFDRINADRYAIVTRIYKIASLCVEKNQATHNSS